MGTRVYVGRLPPRAYEKDLERFFRGYGRITEILLKNGYAFVEFADSRDAEDAIYERNVEAMNLKESGSFNFLIFYYKFNFQTKDRL
ncbi:unnamed protein product [Dracunculus medinensis]|uniref:RRM domain-containing protein n=1 Tax=Dracunculus medinensis TaxID=318479 RepID=A0A0N4U347_DRAME|nr:unnamed protein product [Dracunculus medinensis]